jgi:NAD(P)-dependent dehydrogenase (short-subunit alcohol dehydrogenase family)
LELKGKVAIVTGSGGGGSGRAIARRLAHCGADVVVSDINEAGGHETVQLIDADRRRAVFCRADVGVETEVQALVAFAERTYGGLDFMVNNGSPFYPELLGHWIETVQGNLLGTMYGTLHAIEALRRRGGGAIVNIGSTSALGYGPSHSPAYDAAKAGVMRLTGALAILREKYSIRVNCLVPHWIATEEINAFLATATPQQRLEWRVPDVLITTDEIADAVIQLATDESLAGRIMVWWGGQPPRLIPPGDPGYAELEEFRRT